MDSPQPPSNPDSSESPAQNQARIRRERRDAKIKAGGSARLEKITQLSGRPAEPANLLFLPSNVKAPPLTSETFSASNITAADNNNDPDEADISSHSYTPRSGKTNNYDQYAPPTEESIRQLLRSGAPPPQQGMRDNPFSMMSGPQAQEGGPGGPAEEDPMMKILQQMMGGMGGGGPGGAGGLPPGLAGMLGGAGGGGAAGPPGMEQKVEGETYAYVWRIVHALSAFALGLYIVSTTAFSGSLFSRTQVGINSGTTIGQNFFWVFATAELGLQSFRFFLEKGTDRAGAGWMGMVLGILPEPWRGWVGLAVRYSGIWTTIVADAMVVVFVLGVVAWWGGDVEWS